MNWDPKGLVDIHYGVESGWGVYRTGYLTCPYEVRMESSRPKKFGETRKWLFDTAAAAQRFAGEEARREKK